MTENRQYSWLYNWWMYSILIMGAGFIVFVALKSLWIIAVISTLPPLGVAVMLFIRRKQMRSQSMALVSSAMGLFLALGTCFLIILQSGATGIFAKVVTIGLNLALAGMVGTPIALMIAARIYHSADYWRRRGKQGEQRLLEYLKNPDFMMRSDYAARVLGDLRVVEAVEPLIGMLHHEHPLARAEAARALGAIGDERSVPELERMAVDDKGVDEDNIPNSEIAFRAIEQIDRRTAA